MQEENKKESRGQEGRPTVAHFDYKDVATLKHFCNPHGRITARKHTGLSAGMQRKLAKAVKNARFMGLLPYVQK
jgi:small subunit ribosomal protein S18